MSLFRPLPGAALRDVESGRVVHLDRGFAWNVFADPLRIGEAWEGARRLYVTWDAATWRTRIFENDLPLSPWRVSADGEAIAIGRAPFVFLSGATPPRDPRARSAVEDVLAALSERDPLAAAPALARYAEEVLAGKRDVETGLAAISHLSHIDEARHLAVLVDDARACAFDAEEVGLRLTAVKVLGAALPAAEARRALEALRVDADARVRGAAIAALR